MTPPAGTTRGDADASPDVSDVIVVGAGLTGLSCAHELRKRGLRVLVLEAGKRVGGVVGTVEKNGFLFETGPNTIPASARNIREVAAELDVDSQLVISRSEASCRYLFMNGGLHELPSGPGGLLRTPLLSGKAKRRLMSEPFRRYVRPKRAGFEPTFEQFLNERIGGEATRTLAGAFVRGVYAAEIEELGSSSAFPRLVSMCEESGGLVRGMMARRKAAKRARKAGTVAPMPGPKTSATDLISFGGGMGTLTAAFARSLDGAVSTSTPIAQIDRGPGGWRAVLEGGESLACRELVLAVPAPVAHPLVALCAPERLDLDGLRDIRHAAVTTVHLGLEGVTLPPGFGFLVPPDEDARGDSRTPRVLGMLFLSNIFDGRAPSGTASISAMFRGGEVADLVGDALVDRAVAELEKALVGYRATHPSAPVPQNSTRVVASFVQRWTNVIPRYAPHHSDRMEQLRASCARLLPGLHLVGSYVGGVSVDDRIRVGRETAALVQERLTHLSSGTGSSDGSNGGHGPDSCASHRTPAKTEEAS